MIKFKIRRNLIYLFILQINFNIRKIFSIIIERNFDLKAPYLYLYMMVLGEFIGGLSVYIYQSVNLRKIKEVKNFEVNIIHNRKREIKIDNYFKIFSLIIIAGFFDFAGYLIPAFCIPKISIISQSIKSRIGCVTTMASSLICTYALIFKVG